MHSRNLVIDDAAWASPWRRRRVGEKALLSMGLVLTALLSEPWPGCSLVAAAALLLMLGSARVRPALVLVVMTAPMAFLLIGTLPVAAIWHGMDDMAWGSLNWQTQGFAVGPLRFTADSLTKAASLWAHSLAGTLAFILLATTTPMVDLLSWFRRLRVPDALIEIASLTYRLLFLLLGTTLALRAAQHARLGDGAGWRRRWSITAGSVGSVMLMTWQRASRLQTGLEGRGYEEALLTLTPKRARSWQFLILSLLGLAAIWAANVAWQMWGAR